MRNLTLLLLLVVILPLGFVRGQSDNEPLTLVWDNEYEGDIIPNKLFWEADSQTLYFTVRRYDGEMTSYRYEPVSDALILSEQDLPSFELSPDQQAHFGARNTVGDVAPDQETFAYVSEFEVPSSSIIGSRRLPLLAIGNLNSQTFLPTRQSVYGRRILWSDDSTALVIQHSTPYGGQEVITYVRSESRCSYSWNFCDFSEILLTTLGIGRTIFDISPNGQQVLYPNFETGLMLWDVTQDAQFGELIARPGIALPVDNVIGAAFLPDDADAILLVNESGIMKYHIGDQSMELINPSVSSTWAEWAMFSPDNRWVAMLADGSFAMRQLFVVPVELDE